MLSLAATKVGRRVRVAGRCALCKIGIDGNAATATSAVGNAKLRAMAGRRALSKLHRRDGKKRPPNVRPRGRITAIADRNTGMEKAAIFFHRMRQSNLPAGKPRWCGDRVHRNPCLARAKSRISCRMESRKMYGHAQQPLAAGFVESIPYSEQIQLAECPVTASN